ncbi:hypothetical protein HYPSUDRAFT_464775 [Hypholoma sublateritium FD-334 SS-4]|uniref:Uncharacterized protein n=1 Tax=Hypholoma sublateritium (strain FD-334 SS-4) TaxID=945553 RepID=A0A0D2P1I2_HYPSF|nr:hypothetical protein HYPSUDRAFT_464775 [Hypholoma sublateritium FD-334 SS-4]
MCASYSCRPCRLHRVSPHFHRRLTQSTTDSSIVFLQYRICIHAVSYRDSGPLFVDVPPPFPVLNSLWDADTWGSDPRRCDSDNKHPSAAVALCTMAAASVSIACWCRRCAVQLHCRCAAAPRRPVPANTPDCSYFICAPSSSADWIVDYPVTPPCCAVRTLRHGI